MKNHRRLRNSKLLRFSILIVLSVLCVPLVLSASTSPGALALAGLPLLGALRMEEAKDPAAPDAVGIPDAIKAIEDKTLPMSQRLGVALKALQGVDPTGQLADIKGKLKIADESITAKDGEITNLKSEIANLKAQITALQTDVKNHDDERAKAEKKASDLEAKEQDLDKRAEAKAREKVAALGFPASKLPKADDKLNGDDARKDLLAQLEKAATPEARGLIVAKLRQLRDDAVAKN